MKSIVSTVLFLSTTALIFAQGNHIRLEVASTVDTSNAEIARITQLWERYLNSNPDSVYLNPYWMESEQRQHKPFDLVAHTRGRSLYEALSQWRIYVVGVSMIGEAYIIETAFFGLQGSDPWQLYLAGIFLTGARQDEGSYRLRNALPINTQRWTHEQVGSIEFVFPPDQAFDRAIAEQINRFVDSLATVWQTAIVPITYYFADDFSRVANALGIKHQPPAGDVSRIIVDSKNRMIYSGGLSEWDPHEFVHIYLDPLFPRTNEYFREGYATLVGGSAGHELSWHIKRFYESLKQNPELDLLAFLDMGTTIGAQRFAGGLLCKAAEEHGGLNAIRKLMTYGSEDQDLYRAILDVFGVDRERFNEFLKAKLVEYAEH